MALISAHILLVDDNEDMLLSLRLLLQQYYQKITALNRPSNLLSLLRKESIDLILLDMNYREGESNGQEGLHWIKRIRDLNPDIPILSMTAYADISLAVRAVKNGAIDFVIKPCPNEKLLATVNMALQLRQSRQEISTLRAQKNALVSSQDKSPVFVGESKAIREVKKQIQLLAPTDANVLITGENGTGKEVAAQAIHYYSYRKDESFVAIDLGAIPENLLESELFGYKKGAFTDAQSDKTGRFVEAHKGTLFLDEIGNLALPSQAKMLRVIQNRKVYPLGAAQSQAIDVRIISASNAPLQKLSTDGTFRTDLYYRINTVEVNLPPLRLRENDVILLAEYFLAHFLKKYRKHGLNFEKHHFAQMKKHSWPGNVRELQHCIERAVILAQSRLDAFDHLDQPKESNHQNWPQRLDDLEKQAIQKALKKHQGNISRAAESLGITRTALYRRLEKHGL